MPIRPIVLLLVATFVLSHAAPLFAGSATRPSSPAPIFLLDADDDNASPKPSTAPSTNPAAGRYFFNLLDTRSRYGADFFPDPFLGPEFDSEKQLEADYLHAEKRGLRDDQIDAGFQWNLIGQLTVAGEFGWDSEHASANSDSAGGDSESTGGTGFENVTLSIYHPVFQYVTPDNFLDYTAAVRLDAGFPTRTQVSGKDLELTPYLGHLLRIGDSISIEAWDRPAIHHRPPANHPAHLRRSGRLRNSAQPPATALDRKNHAAPGTGRPVPLLRQLPQRPLRGPRH
jgi:hypothetical protein